MIFMTQKSQQNGQYIDRVCISHKRYLEIVEELKGEGYSFYGLVSLDPRLYQETLEIDSLVQRGVSTTLSNERADRRKKKNHFKNLVEEITWELQQHGCDVQRTTAYFHGHNLDDMVAFFYRPNHEERCLNMDKRQSEEQASRETTQSSPP